MQISHSKSQQKTLSFSLISCVYGYAIVCTWLVFDVAGERMYHVSWISGSLFCTLKPENLKKGNHGEDGPKLLRRRYHN